MTIKSIFRWFRRKLHNDLYEKFEALRNDLNAIAQTQTQAQIQAQAQADRLHDYLDAVLNNQIALASHADRLALYSRDYDSNNGS